MKAKGVYMIKPLSGSVVVPKRPQKTTQRPMSGNVKTGPSVIADSPEKCPPLSGSVKVPEKKPAGGSDNRPLAGNVIVPERKPGSERFRPMSGLVTPPDKKEHTSVIKSFMNKLKNKESEAVGQDQIKFRKDA